MACPPEITVHNFNASFDMNKKEGDDTSGMLKMQGLPWLVRQAASYSAVSINLKQFKDERGVEHLDQEQVSTGGVKQLEPRLLNGEWGERDVQFWGLVKGQNKSVADMGFFLVAFGLTARQVHQDFRNQRRIPQAGLAR